MYYLIVQWGKNHSRYNTAGALVLIYQLFSWLGFPLITLALKQESCWQQPGQWNCLSITKQKKEQTTPRYGKYLPSISLGWPRLLPSSWINIHCQRSAPWQWTLGSVRRIGGEKRNGWLWLISMNQDSSLLIEVGHLCLSYTVWMEKGWLCEWDQDLIWKRGCGEISLVKALHSGDQSWQRVDTQ